MTHSWPDHVLERSAQQLSISPGPETLWAWHLHKLPACFQQHSSHEPPELPLWLGGSSMGWAQEFLSHTTAAGHWKTLLLCLAAEEPGAPALPWAHCDPGQVLWLFFASFFLCMKRTAALPCTARGCDGSCVSSRAIGAAHGCRTIYNLG